MPNLAPGTGAMSRKGNKVKELTDEEREDVFRKLLLLVDNHGENADPWKLNHGAFATVAKEISVHPTTLSRIFERAQNSKENSLCNRADVRSKKDARCRNHKWN